MKTTTWMVAALLLSSTAYAGVDEGSFAPTSFKVPILSIVLQDSTAAIETRIPIYTCTPSATNDCFVDLADSAAISTLFGNLDVDAMPGSFDTLIVSNCAVGANVNPEQLPRLVKGSVVINGTTYYTAAGANPLTTDQSMQGYASVVVPAMARGGGGCSPVSSPLPQRVTVQNGMTVELSAFFSLKNLAKAGLNQPMNGGNIQGACTDRTMSTSVVCTSYGVDLVAYQGTTAPTVESYLVSPDAANPSKASANFLLLIDSAGKLFGGFFRDYFTATSVPFERAPGQPIGWGGGFMFPIVENGIGDGGVPTYVLQSPASNNMCGVKFSAWERQTHTSTIYYCDTMMSGPYLATEQ
jgi:hypothetical protein